MKILGVDFGLRKTGLAYAEGQLAEPFLVVKEHDELRLVEKIGRVVNEEGIEKIVIGVSEGKMAEKQREFGAKMAETLRGVSVVYWDETLTSADANRMSIEAGVKRSRRKRMEDAFAAAVLLQSWLDNI